MLNSYLFRLGVLLLFGDPPDCGAADLGPAPNYAAADLEGDLLKKGKVSQEEDSGSCAIRVKV